MRRLLKPFVFASVIAATIAVTLRADAAGTDIGAQMAHMVSGIVGYARWPVQPTSYRLCVAGKVVHLRADRLTAEFGEHAVAVSYEMPHETGWVRTCDILYLGKLSLEQRYRLLNEAVERPTLTISEDDDACADASMFCLAIKDNYVALLINLDAVSRSAIRINPKVLQMVRRKQVQS
ncbi:MAG: YfiR family protein [Betaproteobacteria bacterium]|nr:YfiR family protein [Betaproteobacteria bacterium]